MIQQQTGHSGVDALGEARTPSLPADGFASLVLTSFAQANGDSRPLRPIQGVQGDPVVCFPSPSHGGRAEISREDPLVGGGRRNPKVQVGKGEGSVAAFCSGRSAPGGPPAALR